LIFSTSRYIGKQAYLTTDETDEELTVKKIGRVHHFVFDKKVCIGVLIKRPDVAMMFRRKDIFASLSSLTFQSGTVILDADYEDKANEFLKKKKINLAHTFVYDGMTVNCENGKELGTVDSITCNSSGKIEELKISDGAMSDALLGVRNVPGEYVIGVKAGTGTARLVSTEGDGEEDFGVLVVNDDAGEVTFAGGASEKLAAGSVVAKKKAGEYAGKLKEKATPALEKGKEKAIDLGKKGAQKGKEKATEKAKRDLESTKKGFIGFKDEFKKAYKGDD
jgi:uncharacterized protein YrrD